MVSAARPCPRSRRGQRGQALLFALIALLIASIAAAFLAEDLSLREKALQEEGARFHLRALLDGALADALARLAEHRPLEDDERWGAGFTSVERFTIDEHRTLLRVHASYMARRAAAEATVLVHPEVKVLSWRRIHPG
jgi:type II secretory pathway component PulK